MNRFKKFVVGIYARFLKFRAKHVNYISGGDRLPPPLDKEEEERWIRALGIESERKKAREVLIERNLRLVVYIARKFENTGIGVEDLISIGAIGLIKAINTFKPEKKIKLATYASRCIENEILMCLRKNGSGKTNVSFDEPLNVDWDGNELLLSDILGSDQDTVNRGIEKETEEAMLLEAVSRLNPREQTIMELRFGLHAHKEHTQKEVADRLGISQSYISRLEKRIIQRLKRELERAAG